MLQVFNICITFQLNYWINDHQKDFKRHRLNHLTHGLPPGSRTNRVHQTTGLLVNRGQSAEMVCSHDLGGKYLEMRWFQQLPGESLKQIVFTVPYNSQHQYGDSDQDKFTAVKNDAERGEFTVNNVGTADSGVYFCAVSAPTHSHTLSGQLSSCTKTTPTRLGLTLN